MRYVIVDDQTDIVNVNTAGNDIGCHQHIDPSVPEFMHDGFPLALVKVRMHFTDVQLQAFKRFGYFLDLDFGGCKDDDTFRLLLFEE